MVPIGKKHIAVRMWSYTLTAIPLRHLGLSKPQVLPSLTSQFSAITTKRRLEIIK